MNFRKLQAAIELIERILRADVPSMAPITPEKINLKDRLEKHQLNKLDGAPEIDDLEPQTGGLGGLGGAATGKGNKGTGVGGGTGANVQAAETGPRGGKIIGKTRSGKPVYDKPTHGNTDIDKWSHEDHSDAANEHYKASDKHFDAGNKEMAAHHDKVGLWHAEQGRKKRLKDTSPRLGAETGPRGGKIIGKTRSGKPVYEHSHTEDHSDYSPEDHEDAANAHEKHAEQYKKGYDDYRGGKAMGNQHAHSKHNYHKYMEDYHRENEAAAHHEGERKQNELNQAKYRKNHATYFFNKSLHTSK